jgi:hypothetical protein
MKDRIEQYPVNTLSVFLLSSFCCIILYSSHPGDYIHDRPGEQASETPSAEILHREAEDHVFWGASQRDCSHWFEFFHADLHVSCRLTSSPTFVLFGLGDLDKTTGDINNE